MELLALPRALAGIPGAQRGPAVLAAQRGGLGGRGQQRLAHLLLHMARGTSPPQERALALRAAREAALADDSGQALDRALAQRGAPTLPVREQVIRFVARRPNKSTGSHPDVRSSPPL